MLSIKTAYSSYAIFIEFYKEIIGNTLILSEGGYRHGTNTYLDTKILELDDDLVYQLYLFGRNKYGFTETENAVLYSLIDNIFELSTFLLPKKVDNILKKITGNAQKYEYKGDLYNTLKATLTEFTNKLTVINPTTAKVISKFQFINADIEGFSFELINVLLSEVKFPVDAEISGSHFKDSFITFNSGNKIIGSRFENCRIEGDLKDPPMIIEPNILYTFTDIFNNCAIQPNLQFVDTSGAVITNQVIYNTPPPTTDK